MNRTLYFCATGKSGLGHLRRLTNIARALHRRSPDMRLALMSNAPLAGITGREQSLYSEIITTPRAEMATRLAAARPAGVVVDTAVLPDLSSLAVPLTLVLRETAAEYLSRFSLSPDRPWDLLLLPNPHDEWRPAANTVPARRVEALGWIYRSAPESAPEYRRSTDSHCRMLIASGGGGCNESWPAISAHLARTIRRVRERLGSKLVVSQVLGPRAPRDARVSGVDELLQPGARLHEVFADTDLLISTAGYNSTLEFAATDVPVLFIPIMRSYDDQYARAQRWADRLGRVLTEPGDARVIDWIVDTLANKRRRDPVDLGPSGAPAAARMLEELLQ